MMGSRSIGELLLRPTALSRFPLSQTSSKPRLIAPLWSSRRALTNSTRSHSAQPQPRKEPVDEPPRQAPADQAANPFADFLPRTNAHGRSPPPSKPESVTQGIDNLFASMNSSNFRRTVPPATRSPTSSDEFSAAHTQHLFGADWSPSTGGVQRRKPLDLNEMTMPDDGLTDILGPVPPVPEIPESEKNYPRLNPSYGRKVELDPTRGRDLVRGINMLGSLMARNKVRADFMKQRYHERPGLKRKRLKSERWRARFKAGFQSVTARVTELTKKGW